MSSPATETRSSAPTTFSTGAPIWAHRSPAEAGPPRSQHPLGAHPHDRGDRPARGPRGHPPRTHRRHDRPLIPRRPCLLGGDAAHLHSQEPTIMHTYDVTVTTSASPDIVWKLLRDEPAVGLGDAALPAEVHAGHGGGAGPLRRGVQTGSVMPAPQRAFSQGPPGHPGCFAPGRVTPRRRYARGVPHGWPALDVRGAFPCTRRPGVGVESRQRRPARVASLSPSGTYATTHPLFMVT